jgi:hypothetical protein
VAKGPYKHTEEELKGIAKDIWAGKIFSTWNITNQDEYPLVFLPLVFLDKKTITEWKKKEVSFIFEYMDKAGPRSINGMPSFFSCKCLTKTETAKMFEHYKKFKEMADKF